MIHITSSGKLVTEFSEAIATLFPDHERKTVGGVDYIGVPHGTAETVMLRRFGHEVPAPVLSQYDWGPRNPFEVQRSTVAFMTTNQRAYVLNGMGTGKTTSALWAFDFLRQTGYATKMLVVAPVSTLYTTWLADAFTFLPHLKVEVLDGTKQRRLKRLANLDADIYVVNHDGLKVVREALDARPDIDVLTIDELAVYRNGKAARTKAMIKFAASKGWVWGMTGSPASLGPVSVWAQCQIVTPNSVPRYFQHFRNRVQYKVTNFKWKDKEGAIEIALGAMQPSVRYSLDDVIELPPVVTRYVDVDLSHKQKLVYKSMREAAAAMIDNGSITAANAGAALQKLLQISQGWVYNSAREIVALDGEARLTACVDLITSAGNKVLVFVPYKHVAAGIAARLEDEGIEHALVSGDTPPGERRDIFNAFQKTSKYKAIVANPNCMAHGVTLTAADTVLWYGPTLSLETFEQANARIRRIGQKHKQQVIMLRSTPAETRMYMMLEYRKVTQDLMLDLFRDRTG